MDHLTRLHLGRIKASLVDNTQACQGQTLAYFDLASMAKRKEKSLITLTTDSTRNIRLKPTATLQGKHNSLAKIKLSLP